MLELLTEAFRMAGTNPLAAVAVLLAFCIPLILAVPILQIVFIERPKRKKFTFGSGLLEALEVRVMARFDVQDRRLSAIEKLVEGITGAEGYACEFKEVFQEYLKCVHDVSANEHIGRKQLVEALDDHMLTCAKILAFFKQSETHDEKDRPT